MEKNISIKLKAAFLLTVFALNTVLAFACSLGLNMGYNKKHHHNKEEEKVASTHSHSHSPGTTPHHHSSTASHSHGDKHSHAGNGSHVHNNASGAHDSQTEKPGEDDCCRDSAVKFQKEDKRPQQSQNTAIKAPVFVAFLSAFLGLELAPEKTTAGTKFLVPRYYPPPDIRIAIQSFLI